MKKIIISAITAAALLFGFAGCSGDLHDDEKNGGSAGTGSWYYISAGNPASAPTVIFNNNVGNKQTANIAQTKTTGNIFFKIDTTKEVEEEDFGSLKKRWFCEEIDENAAKELGWEDKNLSGLAIYCYAEFDPISEGLSVYTHDPECFGAWTGKPMSNDGAVLKDYSVNLNISFDVSALNKPVGTIFVTGQPFGWQYPKNFGWSDGNVVDKQFVSKDSSLVYSYKVEAAEFPSETPELQLVLFSPDVDAKNATSSDFSLQSKNFKIPLKDNSGTPYADFQNKRFENGATINVLAVVDSEGNVKATLK